ncbi:DUF2283 domain-containing protein [Methanobrevibacter olleyae]|uniref:DUF2283 domain-containing protein n=1 Tax=Methanobrevibacter olleyae TaxID=294671 RepID=A0A126R0F5_METOL|nr:DUF2283 domain-containing protein [Methanobrevibacter olleyae]AMK15105.1 hypothetical protein YLM1_0548 [Methanobrevibacter olleyae]
MKDNSAVDYKYDSSADVLAVKVKRDFSYHETIEMDEGILLDFDVNNVPISLEVLDASKRFNVPKYSLHNLFSFNMNVCVNDDCIKIDVTIGVSIHNKQKDSVLSSLINNYANIPNMETELVTA